MLSEAQVQALLAPFGLSLAASQIAQLMTYLEMLLRWNRKMNLTAIRNPEDCVRRHFGESLYLASKTQLAGKLLDIGSGAGFPGLALGIVFPNLQTTLLEPVAKKRAFLKEVARACGMDPVEVRSERLEDFVRNTPQPWFASATARAVGQLGELVPLAADCLEPGGRLCLWLSRDQAKVLAGIHAPIEWNPPIALPLARQREIWVGVRGAQ